MNQEMEAQFPMKTTEIIDQLENDKTVKEAAERLRILYSIVLWFEWCVGIPNSYESKCPICGNRSSEGHKSDCFMPEYVRVAKYGDSNGGFASTPAGSRPSG